ncbi:MAG: hypothetical protein K6F53_13205, partial [Lachnospiraceae bacterium]|nr:hypothetical protein [Lachnospiraceae bacterium]
MKRILSVLLAVAMMLAMSDPSWAAPGPDSFRELSGAEIFGEDGQSDAGMADEIREVSPEDEIPGLPETAEEEEDHSLIPDGAPAHIHCTCCSDTSCGDGHNADIEWAPYGETNSLPKESGYYYLINDVTLRGDQEAGDGIYLCLNGHTVDLNGHYYAGNGKLVITNCAQTESGDIAGGFVCENKRYSGNKPLISAPDLELHNIKASFKNITGTLYGVGYSGTSLNVGTA